MNSSDLRKKFLDFFRKNGHKIVPSSSLMPTDHSVLFTTAGMQQFKPYYLGEESPYGKNTASSQKCFRTSDIEEVGDESHLTFFEMLGNFSFGGYFKKESIKLAYDFITKEMGFEIDYVTIFDPSKVEKGDWRAGVPKDQESYDIWKNEIKIPEDKIKEEGIDNFWGPTGDEGPCGPTTEIYIKNVEGKSLEIWNIVFNEFYCDSGKNLKKLSPPGVDTGMGFERLVMISQGKPSIFETDLFLPIIEEIEKQSGRKYESDKRIFRIIADHIKSSVFLIADGLLPSNVEQGYILRRILRRTVRFGKTLKLSENFFVPLAEKIINAYADIYPELKSKKNDILTVIQKENEKFEMTLERGLKEFERLQNKNMISGEDAFNLYQSYGFPIEITEELAQEKGLKVDVEGFKKELTKHQELSRTASVGMFKSGLADYSDQTIKYHTVTHLLLAALRRVLGDHVVQKGSNITSERLRFDFSHSQKITAEELKQIEEIVNQKIKENLKVEWKELPLEEAKKQGAMGVFGEKYDKNVRVYSIFNEGTKEVFSKEICGGPHVEKTGDLGEFKIKKEESSSAGVRRIKAILK
ncbi:alanine--tRNA ligase [Patescibacteria group bacterium]|nr:alanine--tRNA ligase [Patescibacteria group bacterium]